MRGASRNPRAARFLSAVLLTLRRIAFSLRQHFKAFYPPFLHWNPPLERRSWNGFRICRGFSAHSDAARKSGASCPRSAMKKTAKRSPSFATRSTTRRKNSCADASFTPWLEAEIVRGGSTPFEIVSRDLPGCAGMLLPKKRGEAQPPFATRSTTRRKNSCAVASFLLWRSEEIVRGGQYPIRNCVPRPAPMRLHAAAEKKRGASLRHLKRRSAVSVVRYWPVWRRFRS